MKFWDLSLLNSSINYWRILLEKTFFIGKASLLKKLILKIQKTWTIFIMMEIK